LQEIRGITAQAPSIPLYSTVLGGLSNAVFGDANHWIKNLRQPVRFGEAVEALLQDGYRHFLELSPHPILLGAIQQAFHDTGREGKIIPSLRRQEKEQGMLLSSLGMLYTLGHAIDWQQVLPEGHRCRCIHLPEYTWQSERFWRDDAHLDSHISSTVLNETESLSQADPTPDVAESQPPTRALTRDDLLKVGEAEQKVLLQSYLANNLGRILRQSPSKLDVNRPLIKLGIDSLMAVELRNRMIVDLELTLPILKIITARSIVQLVAQMLTHLTARVEAAGDSQAEKAAGATTSQPPVEVQER
jgi:acyl transferase domain-containing protein